MQWIFLSDNKVLLVYNLCRNSISCLSIFDDLYRVQSLCMNKYSDYYVKQVFQRRRNPSWRISPQKFHLSYKVSFPTSLFFLVPQSSPGPIHVNRVSIWGRNLFPAISYTSYDMIWIIYQKKNMPPMTKIP